MKHHIFSRAIAFHPLFVTLTKSHEAAIMLSQMCYWADKKNNGKFWKTCDQWEEELLFSRAQQERARKAIMEASEASPAPWYFETREGIPAKLYYQIDVVTLAEVCSELPCGRPRHYVKTPIHKQIRSQAGLSPSMQAVLHTEGQDDLRAISETSDKEYIQRLPTYQRVVDTALVEKEAETEVEDLQEKEEDVETDASRESDSLVGGLLSNSFSSERETGISTHSMPADYDPFYDGGTPYAEEDEEDLDDLTQDEEEGEAPDEDYSKEMTQTSVAVITNTKVQSPRTNDDSPAAKENADANEEGKKK